MKPNTLDKDRPYGQVYGLSGVDYEQDGRFYNRAGNEVKAENTEAEANEPEPEKTEEAVDIKPAEVVSSPEPAQASAGDFETMHHMKLKQLVRMYGGDYQDREQAIAFLRGKKAA